tara:strand:- start:654 stop:872 length:219 start_codon:yes stop_codon:yes gene_type:complete
MTKKQMETLILNITTIRDNVQHNLQGIETDIEEATSFLDNAIAEIQYAEESISELGDIIDTFKIAVENGGIK